MTKVKGTPFILVVDGTGEVVHDEVVSIRQAGWNVLGTTDPWEAIQVVAETAPDLIVLDLDMPGIGGSDLCTMIQDDPGLKDIPVIFLSDRASVIGPRLASFIGENACMAKPFNAPALIATARKLLAGPFPPAEVDAQPPAPRSGTRFVRRRRDPVSFGRSA